MSATIDASDMVNKYFRERRGDMEDFHDAFSMRKPRSKSSTMESERKAKVSQSKRQRQREFQRVHGKFNRYLEEVSREVHVDFDIQTCQWSDVLDMLIDAQEALGKRVERDKTFLSRGGMVLADFSTLLQPGLQLIPDELCFLHGSLALVIHLAKNRDKSKRDIIDTIEDITTSLAHAGVAAEDYPEEERLYDALDRLRMTLFENIPSLIKILVPDSMSSTISAPFKFSKTERKLDAIRQDAKRVLDVAKTLRARSAGNADRITQVYVEGIHNNVEGINDRVVGLNNNVQGLNDNLCGLTEQVSGMDAVQQDILAMVNNAFRSQVGLHRMLSDAVDLLNYYGHNPQNPQVSPTTPSRSTRGHSPSSTFPGVSLAHLPDTTIPTLQVILDVEIRHVSQDLTSIRRAEHDLELRARSAAAAGFIVNRNFQRWMTAPGSDFLFVEGRMDLARYGRITPISYVCAQLTQKFQEAGTPTMTTLTFFCGQHDGASDALRGPKGLVRSLLSQALGVWTWVKLDELDLNAFEGSHESITLKELCMVFRMVVAQIPAQYTIHCTIDDINRLERNEWKEEYWDLLGMLDQLVHDGSTEARFKVLLTSPGRSRWLTGDREIKGEQKVLVTDDGSDMGFRIDSLKI